jgi:hypothetical protein
MRSLKVLLAATVVLVAGCKSSEEVLNSDPAGAAVVTEIGQTFDLRVGQTARVGSGQLLVGFRGVAADSRCPVNVQCVWAGDAELRIQVTVGRMAWTDLTVHTGVEPRSARFREHTITAVGLKPETRAGSAIPKESYVVTLKVE